MPMSDKHSCLGALAAIRRNARWPRYKCIGDYHGGAYECDFVSPYTKSAGNVDATLMVLLQDWASDDVLRRPLLRDRITLGHDSSVRTNQRLQRLLHQHFLLELEQVYATNLFPFVKLGTKNAPIPLQDLVRAAREFALPQIEIVRPRLVACLGKATFDAIAVAAGGRRTESLEHAIEVASPLQIGKTQVWCQAHTSQQGTNNRNRKGVDQVERDWARMALVYNERERAKSDGTRVIWAGAHRRARP
jgi:restriction system protein